MGREEVSEASGREENLAELRNQRGVRLLLLRHPVAPYLQASYGLGAARSEASIAALQRDIRTKSGPELLEFIRADIQELKGLLSDRGAINSAGQPWFIVFTMDAPVRRDERPGDGRWRA